MIDIKMGELPIILRPSKIICLLRSYADHAEEMRSEVPERPMFFLKPPSSLLPDGGTVIIPEGVSELHHEVELAFVVGEKGRNIPPGEAESHIMGYTVMMDITARDVQLEAKQKGLPWSEAKGHDTFAPIGSEIVPAESWDWKGKRIWLKVNGETRQDSSTDLLLWSPAVILSRISEVMTLEKGDIVMTGTPAGVGPLSDGDILEAGVEGIRAMRVHVRSGTGGRED
ncbi:acylpyruvase [Thermoplasmatales archaeon ex4484_6]|nr:MAG: acylpyruvase [Thermoplasmatales archaeon ex4484_6]RLF68269.1 MAG: acylpyruvase [Thermoplasmata archaeon]